MAKCSVCGKHGLFFKVNSDGLCKKCQEDREIAQHQYEEKQKSAAQNFYNLLAELYFISKEKVPAQINPIENLKSISVIEERIQTCYRLLNELDKISDLPYFNETIKSHLKYESIRDERIHYAKLHPFGFSVWTHRRDPAISYSQELRNKLTTDISAYKTHWQHKISRIKKNAEFETLCCNLPRHPIILSQENINLLSTSELDDLVKYSRVTAKTNFERIGNFVVIDIETTGLSSINNEITEVGAIRFEDWTPTAVFHSLVKPKKDIPEEITQKTGITNEMVSSAPKFSSIITSLNEFIGKNNIVGHNLPFDLKFLYRNGLDFTVQKRKYYDTLDLAKSTLKKPRMKWDRELESYEINFDYDYDVEDYKLPTLCEYYEIRDNSSSHRAISDALATGILFHNLAQSKIGET